MENNFEIALDLLIKANEKNHHRLEMKKHLNPVLYYAHLCTIKVNAGRGIGHTTYIKNKARPKKDLIIAPTKFAYEEFLSPALKNEYNFYLADNFMFASQGVLFNFEYVYVDQAERVFEESIKIYDFYRYFAARSKTDPLFIFLG